MTQDAAPLTREDSVYGRGFAVLRIFIGVVWLSNATAKATGIHDVDLGVLRGTLLTTGSARGILSGAVQATPLTPLADLYRVVALQHWGVAALGLTIAELAIGAGLLLGVASRVAALGGLLLVAPVWVMLWGQGGYLWTYPVDLVPLALLAVVPAGRVWGLGGHWRRPRRGGGDGAALPDVGPGRAEAR